MSKELFVISDTHFGHKNIITFKTKEGLPLRDFTSVEEMDELMVANWNATVGATDTVYHLGDVVINRRALVILERLNGRKILIKGNHDIFKLKDYTKYFEDIRAYKVMPKHELIMSHIPIHPDCMYRWKLNVHGHLHSNDIGSPKYRSVCVEKINYTPLNLEEIIKEIPNE